MQREHRKRHRWILKTLFINVGWLAPCFEQGKAVIPIYMFERNRILNHIFMCFGSGLWKSDCCLSRLQTIKWIWDFCYPNFIPPESAIIALLLILLFFLSNSSVPQIFSPSLFSSLSLWVLVTFLRCTLQIHKPLLHRHTFLCGKRLVDLSLFPCPLVSDVHCFTCLVLLMFCHLFICHPHTRTLARIYTYTLTKKHTHIREQ